MRRISVVGPALVASLPLVAAAAMAQEQATVTIHGFVSQGYIKSSPNRLNSAPTEKGSFSFSEEAVNVTWQPSPRLRVGAQLFANDLGTQGNHRASFDWALGDYRWRDELGVRAGRLKLPLGLYSTIVDADAARPEILQPDAAYSAGSRDTTVTVDGAQAYGLVRLGAAGDLEYEGWAGTADLESSPELRRLLVNTAEGILPTLGLAGGGYSLGEMNAPVKIIYGAVLEWRPPVAGLRLRSSFNRGEVDLTSSTLLSGFAGTPAGPLPVALQVRTAAHIDLKLYSISSVEYQRGALRASAEYYRQDFDIRSTLTGLPTPVPVVTQIEGRPEGYYAQIAYRLTSRFQASAYYSALFADRDDHDGERAALGGLPAHSAYQKALAVTGRLDVTPHWLLKMEVHDVRGTQALNAFDQPHGPAGLEKDWWMFVAKATFHF
jgi:hypothetical protein